MRVAFDQQIFLLQEYGGISRYFCSLCEALKTSVEADARIFAPLHYNGHLDAAPKDLMTGRRVPRLRKTFRPVSALSEHLARRAIARFRPDVIHETYYSTRPWVAHRGARVITVYDMISERFPAMFAGGVFTEIKRTSVFRADHVLCISESTRRDLVNIFDLPAERTSVVHLGYDRFRAGSPDENGYAGAVVGRPFLLHVGSRGGYKNFVGLLRAYAASPRLVGHYALVCFGGGALTDEEHRLIQELKVPQESVIQLGGDDSVLAGLYQGAAALIYPSLYEGFGIPPLEAMSLGCLVLCSDRSSIPEVVGDAGGYFNPEDVESIRFMLESTLASPTRCSELVDKGRARCVGFSWERCARETHDVYRGLL